MTICKKRVEFSSCDHREFKKTNESGGVFHCYLFFIGSVNDLRRAYAVAQPAVAELYSSTAHDQTPLANAERCFKLLHSLLIYAHIMSHWYYSRKLEASQAYNISHTCRRRLSATVTDVVVLQLKPPQTSGARKGFSQGLAVWVPRTVR